MACEPNVTKTDWTLGRLLDWTTGFFREKQIDEPRLCAEILLARAVGCRRIELYTRFDQVPDEPVKNTYRDLVKKAGRNVPIAYLVGYKEFYSLEFEVNEHVLIPRPETETLVEHAVESCRQTERSVVLDVGTGSGCVIITILTHVSDASGTATDIATGALDVARRNAARHDVAGRVEFVEADRLDIPDEHVPAGGYDLIVCNPPYVVEADMPSLAPGVRDHEPRIALTPGGDGLAFFRAIAAGAPDLLKSAGAVMVEFGAGQGEAVAKIFRAGGSLANVGTYRGSADPHDRVMHFAKTC